MVGKRKKALPFPPPPVAGPFAWPGLGEVEEERSWEGRESPAPRRGESADLLARLLPSLLAAPSHLPPFLERPVTAACNLQPYYDLCA